MMLVIVLSIITAIRYSLGHVCNKGLQTLTDAYRHLQTLTDTYRHLRITYGSLTD
jgi:hypothetical protein